MSRKVAFIPYTKVDPANTERTPKLLYLLSKWFEVVPIEVSSFDKKVYDQGGNKFSRYLLFLMNEAAIFWRTLRRGKGEGISLVFAEGSYYALAGGLAARLLDVPMVWDNHGNIVDFSRVMGKSRYWVLGNLMMERMVARMAATVLVVSDKEVRSYASLGFDPRKLMALPTCADMGAVRERCVSREQARERLGIPEGEKVVLFFGTLKYLPNLDAAEYLVDEMLPEVRRKVPGSTLYIAGTGELAKEPPEGVKMLGFVPDLYVWISAADVCVAPMWRGVGILTKVIDMMSAGRPTVVSPLALEGIPELKHGINCLVGRDRGQFAEEVTAVLRDPGRGEEIGRNGRELIVSSYSWEVEAPRLMAHLGALMETGRAQNYRQVHERPAPK